MLSLAVHLSGHLFERSDIFLFFRHKLRQLSHANSNQLVLRYPLLAQSWQTPRFPTTPTRPPSEPPSRRGFARSAEKQRSKLEDRRGWTESPVLAVVWLEVRIPLGFSFPSRELVESFFFFSVRSVLMGISTLKTQTLQPRPLRPRYQRQHQASTRIPPRSTSQNTSSSRKRHLPASPSMASSHPVPSRRSLRTSCAR